MTFLTAPQVAQLLRPINPARVAKDGKGHEHVPQQDVRAHLIRIFGFGGWDTEILHHECIFEHNRLTSDGKPSQRWDIGYRVVLRLTIKDGFGREVATYEDGATATAQNQSLGDGHDLAFKSAISYALKRCATNLGDQFGLSLYNKGQLEALVRGTLVMPPSDEDTAADDVQEGVPEQSEDELLADTRPEPVASETRVADLLTELETPDE